MADSEEKKPKKTRKRQRIEDTIRASDPWEPVGQTPMPDIPDLRNWDMRLMKTYPPLYAPFCDVCCFCTYGKCDLTAGRRGGCGIDIAGQQGRIVLLAACMGLSAHGGHARHVIDHLIEHYGEDLKIDLGGNVAVNMLDAIMYYMASDYQAYFISGEPPRASGSRHPRAPMVGVFQTRNGYLVLGPSWPRIAKVIGKEWMITDPRFSTVDKRFENKKELIAMNLE